MPWNFAFSAGDEETVLANHDSGVKGFKKSARSHLERGLFFVALLLLVVVIGLVIGLIVVIKRKDDTTEVDMCVSDECAMASSRILQSMDRNADPCQDFYTFACGSWKKKHVIPDDKSSFSSFSILWDDVQLINKNLLEDADNLDVEEHAWKKAKDMYTSCINTDHVEQKNLSVTLPLMQEIGGWPVLGTNPGGNWNEASFDIVALLVNLKKYSNAPVMSLYVSSDDKNSTQHILYLDQPYFILPGRTYYLEDSQTFQQMKEAYVTYGSKVAALFGADEATARSAMEDVLIFETELANISMRSEDRRDSEALYNKMTIEEMMVNFTEPQATDPIQFNWYNYISCIMGLEGVDIPVNLTEPIVVRDVPYFQKLFSVLQKYSKRTITNYIVWTFMKNRVSNLPKRFEELKREFDKVVYGKETTTSRWKTCENYVTMQMGMAVGQKFVKQEFDETAKDTVLEMVGNIRSAFNEILDELDWMDDQTKVLAREKAEAIRNWIGYPDEILNTTRINEIYENVTVNKDEYFQNVLNNLQRTSVEGLRVLRDPYDKNEWTTPPSTANAYYSPLLNVIMFPAGILQPPFYGKNQPKSMNYGRIGSIIGHEITHGFDDVGRQYNKDGDLEQWWVQNIIEHFKEKAQCYVDQYGKFLVPEANMTINGINTQGENIADNGGVKQSYRAYRRWVEEQGKEEPKLPGLDYTHDQLFFINFAQVWCTNMKEENAIRRVQAGVHSPGQFRVIGTIQNSADFAQAFSCPKNSYLNPDKKCAVW